MEGIGFEAVAVLFVLLPGFLAARTVQSQCVRPSQTELDKVVEALLYSFLIYAAFVAIHRRIPLAIIEREGSGGAKVYKPDLGSIDLLILLGYGLLLGIIMSVSITNDLHGRALRWIRATKRTTRATIWSDVFHDKAAYIQIEFADGRGLIGWPKYFSDTPEEGSLFLENAAWIDDQGNEENIAGPGILITKKLPIQAIMFLGNDRAGAPSAAAPAPATSPEPGAPGGHVRHPASHPHVR